MRNILVHQKLYNIDKSTPNLLYPANQSFDFYSWISLPIIYYPLKPNNNFNLKWGPFFKHEYHLNRWARRWKPPLGTYLLHSDCHELDMLIHWIRQLGALSQRGILKSQTYYQSRSSGDPRKSQVPLGVQITQSCSYSRSMSFGLAATFSRDQDTLQEKQIKSHLLLQSH